MLPLCSRCATQRRDEQEAFRFPIRRPVKVREIKDGLVVVDNGDTPLAYVYGRNPKQPKTDRLLLLFTEARTLATAIALLPYHPPPDWMQVPSSRGKKPERWLLQSRARPCRANCLSRCTMRCVCLSDRSGGHVDHLLHAARIEVLQPALSMKRPYKIRKILQIQFTSESRCPTRAPRLSQMRLSRWRAGKDSNPRPPDS